MSTPRTLNTTPTEKHNFDTRMKYTILNLSFKITFVSIFCYTVLIFLKRFNGKILRVITVKRIQQSAYTKNIVFGLENGFCPSLKITKQYCFKPAVSQGNKRVSSGNILCSTTNSFVFILKWLTIN